MEVTFIYQVLLSYETLVVGHPQFFIMGLMMVLHSLVGKELTCSI